MSIKWVVAGKETPQILEAQRFLFRAWLFIAAPSWARYAVLSPTVMFTMIRLLSNPKSPNRGLGTVLPKQ